MEKLLVRGSILIILVLIGMYISAQYIRFQRISIEGGIAFVGFPFPMLETEAFYAYAGDGVPPRDYIRKNTREFENVTIRYGGIIANLICVTGIAGIIAIPSVKNLSIKFMKALLKEFKRA